MNNYDNNYERSINNYDDGYDSGRKDRQRNNLREALLGAMRSAKPDGGIGDQEMDRAKRARNMEIGGMAGSVVPVVGAPVGQIYGAQHDDLVKGAGQGLTTASEISPLVLGMGTFGTSMLAPAAMKAVASNQNGCGKSMMR